MFLFPKRLHSEQRTERAKRRFVLFSLGAVFFLTGAVAALSWGSYRAEMTLRIVRISGAETVSEEEVQKYVTAQIAGTYGGIFNRANSFIYPRKTITRGLLEAFPRLAAASISRNGLTELSVDVTERIPSYLWCGEKISSAPERRGCYFLDPDGIVFASAPYFSGNVYFEVYGRLGDESFFSKNNEQSLGRPYLPKDFRRVIAFKESLAASGMPPEKFTAEDSGVASFYFPSGIRIIFDMTQDFEAVFLNFLAVIAAEPLTVKMFSSDESTPYGYVDLRFENKVFYQ